MASWYGFFVWVLSEDDYKIPVKSPTRVFNDKEEQTYILILAAAIG